MPIATLRCRWNDFLKLWIWHPVNAQHVSLVQVERSRVWNLTVRESPATCITQSLELNCCILEFRISCEAKWFRFEERRHCLGSHWSANLRLLIHLPSRQQAEWDAGWGLQDTLLQESEMLLMALERRQSLQSLLQSEIDLDQLGI